MASVFKKITSILKIRDKNTGKWVEIPAIQGTSSSVVKADYAIKAGNSDYAIKAGTAENSTIAKKLEYDYDSDLGAFLAKPAYVSGNSVARAVAGNIKVKNAAKADHATTADGITGVLPVDNGGTGVSSLSELKTALGVESSVSYASSAGTADYATSAGSADSATNANYATSAGSADRATSAESADHADHATAAQSADYATSAGSADRASTAGVADFLTNPYGANYDYSHINELIEKISALETRVSALELKNGEPTEAV